MIKDSGNRKEFESGALRDIVEGKGRCDLLPLNVAAKLVITDFFIAIDYYMVTGDIEHLYNAIKVTVSGDFATALLEVAKQFEEGAKKYGERNWEKGIPLHCYIDSAVRHYLKYMRGDDDEPHYRAVLWNLMCAIWTHKNKPEMIDLPFAERKNE